MVERYVIAIENILQKSDTSQKRRMKAIRNILYKIESDYKELEKVFEQTHDELGERLNMIVRQQREIDKLKKELKKLKNRVDK